MERTLIVCWCKRVCRQKTDLLRIRQQRIAYYLAHIPRPHPQQQYHFIAAGDPQKEPGAYFGRARRLSRKSLTLISEERGVSATTEWPLPYNFEFINFEF